MVTVKELIEALQKLGDQNVTVVLADADFGYAPVGLPTNVDVHRFHYSKNDVVFDKCDTSCTRQPEHETVVALCWEGQL